MIEGEVVGRPTDAPPPLLPKRRKRWPWIVGGIGAVLALCLAVPVVVFGGWVLHGAIEAGEGASTPMEAFEVFRMSFNHGGREGEMMAARTVTGRHADDILNARATFLADRERDIARHPEWVWGEIKIGWAPADAEPDSVDSDGDHARMVAWVAVGGHPADGRTDGWFMTTKLWRSEAVRQRDGWRLTAVTMPTWCGALLPDGSATGYSKC